MSDPVRARVVTLSDFNLATLNGLMANDPGEPPVDVVSTDFGQVQPLLLDADAACWRDRPAGAVVWVRPEAAAPAFGALRRFEPVPGDAISGEVDGFADMLIAAADRVGSLFVPTWTLPLSERGLGFLDLTLESGVRGTLARMNLQLAGRLSGHPTIHLLDASRWLRAAGAGATSAKLWYMAKVPFTNAVFEMAVQEIKAALRGIGGRARKLIVVDLDDTLWGGVVGDEGWESLRLGGHDAVGEAYADFQRALRDLTNRGIVLGIVSKNTEEVALEAIRENPEMVLGLDDFAGWRINWNDKARNIADLTAELNLGLDSVVFIDDSAFERGRVREALPEVLVPDWPGDPLLYRERLTSLDCFDAPSLSEEDRARAGMYAAERRRDAARGEVGSADAWLASLGLEVHVEDLDRANLARAAQLLNKTNQMNLRTRRMTETELSEWAASPRRRVLAFRVADRFGDSGLTGLASIEVENGRAELCDFVMSCRVMGRGVERAIVSAVVEAARQLGASSLAATHIPTARNEPCLRFFEGSGFVPGSDEGSFTRDPLDPYEVPEHIALHRGVGEGSG